MSDCDHDTIPVTLDDGSEHEVCPICDDVQVETIDDKDEDNQGIGGVGYET